MIAGCGLFCQLSSDGGKLYDSIFRLCVSLPKSDIMCNPLRRDKADTYHRSRYGLYRVGDDSVKRRKRVQERYRQRRRRRLATNFRVRAVDVEELEDEYVRLLPSN